MKDVKLFGLVIVGMVLLFSPTIQASSDMETPVECPGKED